METTAHREELRSSIRYYERKTDELNDEIRELKSKLETVCEFKEKYELSCNQFFSNIENRRRNLNGLNAYSDKIKSARLYQNHMNELLHGSFYANSVDKSDAAKRELEHKIEFLQQEIEDRQAKIHSYSSRISELRYELANLYDE